MQSLDAFTLGIASHVLETGQSFPQVTIPDFAVRAAAVRVATQSDVLYYRPVVQLQQRADYEVYTQQMGHDYLERQLPQEIRQMQRQDDAYSRATRPNITAWLDQDWCAAHHNCIPPFLHNGTESNPYQVTPAPDQPYYLPLWHASPVQPTPDRINADVLHARPGVLHNVCVDYGTAVLGGLYSAALYESEISHHWWLSQYRYDFDHRLWYEPSSTLVYPVWDDVEVDQRQVVGTLQLQVHWRKLLESGTTVPDPTGLYVEIANGWHQSAVYRLDGNEVTYLGASSSSHTERGTPIVSQLSQYQIPQTSSYTAVDLDTNAYRIYVYGSDDMVSVYVTGIAWQLGLATTAIWLLFGILLACCERLRIKATRPGVALEPEIAAFPDEHTLHEEGSQRPLPLDEPKLGSIFNDCLKDLAPIAEMTPRAKWYPKATILHAELVGFATWAAEHTAPEAFELLQSIHKVLDRLAKQYGVTKVEMVSDCYVAATGLHPQQTEAAVKMAKFCHACMQHLATLPHGLEWRVGLHTGSVQGGLCDDRTFQLFGESMLVASRLQQRGKKSRMHASESVVNELYDAGKLSWIERTPIGKGDIQTYFVNVTR